MRWRSPTTPAIAPYLWAILALGEIVIIVRPEQMGRLNSSTANVRERLCGADGHARAGAAAAAAGQLSFADRPTWGGPRSRSGRKAAKRANVRHRTRPEHRWYQPVRAARRLNARLRRRGSLWGDRDHRRDLVSPRDVRNALVYIINNHLKHHEWDAGRIDPCSSAPWFSGWMHRPRPPDTPSPVAPPRTWLLRALRAARPLP
jgi:hypothetical protein